MATWGFGKNDPSQELLALREKMASKESTIAAYETQLLRKTNDHDELKKLYDEVINKLRAESEKALTLEKDLRQCTEDLLHEKLSVQNMQATLNTAQQTVKTANLGTRELEATLESMSHQSNTYQERCRSLERDKGKLEERVRELQSLLSQPQSTNSSKRKQSIRPRSSSLSNFRITTLETDVNDMRATLQHKAAELDIISKKLAVAQTEANRLGNEKNAMEKRTTSQLAELEAALAEKEEELHYLRNADSGGGREQELLERIEEDEAKISALEMMLRSSKDNGEIEENLKQMEMKLQEEGRRTQKLVQQHLQAKEENESLLLELNMARSQIKELEVAIQERRRKSSLLNIDSDMDGILDSAPNEADATLPLDDEDAVEYIERLLVAIDRLRDERDSLRRDVQFLESESKFAIEALEAKLSASMATTSSGDETVRTMNQLKMEMDALHSQLEDMEVAYNAELRQKGQEIRRLGQALTALAVVSEYASSSRLVFVASDSTMHAQADDRPLKELEKKLDMTMVCLEAMTSQRDDLADTLRNKESAWEEEMQAVRFGQQQSNRNVQDLSSQIDELTKALEQVESERSSLALHITNLESELQNAQDDLANAESRYSDLQFHQLSSMSSNEATMNLRTQIKELENRVMRRTEQLGIHQHDIRRLETNLRLQEERLSEMTMELEMVNAEKEAMVEDCADAREVRDEALRRVEEMEDAAETLENAADENDATIVTLIGVIVDTIAKARQAVREAESSEASHEGLQDTLDHVEELKEENGHLEHVLQKYNERINQLTAQIVNLEGQHATSLASTDALKADFQARSIALQNEVENLRLAKENMEESHSTATWELEGELDRLRQRLRETEETLRRSSEIDSVQQTKDQGLELLQSRLSALQTSMADAESRHRSLMEAQQEELHTMAASKHQIEDALADLQRQLAKAQAEHEKAASVLTAELVKERQNLEQAQQSFDRLEEDRQKLIDELGQIREVLNIAHTELEAEKELSVNLTRQHTQRLNDLNTRVQELSTRVQEEQSSRQSEEHEHQSILSACKEQHNAIVIELERELERLREDVGKAERSRLASEEEKSNVQEQTTGLVAKIEQNKSLQRLLEGQAQERDRSIVSLRLEISTIQAKLNNAEHANAKATLNVSLLTAQHKREMADAQRELERLRSKNLEQIIAELEERNQDMERLLKEKCTEIEENDDRTLEMLKENKKLNTKVDSLTRKVHALQTKVATLKATSSPKPDAVPTATSKMSPPTSASIRQRSTTLNSAQSPVQLSFPQRPSMPSASTSRPLSRVASGPSIASRAKTPDQTHARVFSRTPERVRASTSPVGETLSVAGKKRRAPDDFEGCDSMPPQAFTAESVPKDENRTPRVRRVLSSLQSGFTPVRNSARPVVPLPSPRRNTPGAQASPYIADVTNSPLNIMPPPSASKSNKRSWLGKIRGAGTSQGRHQ